MTTTLYFLPSALPDFSRGEGDASLAGSVVAWTPFELSLARGASTGGFSGINTAAGPTPGIEVRASSTVYDEWITPPLDRDIQILGTMTANLWATESNMSANAGVGIIVQRLLSDGSVYTTQSVANNAEVGAELGTTPSVRNESFATSGVAIAKGDRLRVRVYFDDAVGSTMVGGYTTAFSLGSPTAGVDGDSYITFAENFGFMTEGPGTALEQITGATYYNIGQSSASGTRVAQSFVAPSDGTLQTIDPWVGKQGAPGDNLEVALQADSSGVPSGTDLASASVAGTSLSISPAAVTSFNIADMGLIGGTKYWIVFRRSGSNDITNYYTVLGAATGGTLQSGALWYWNGTVWALEGTFATDCYFTTSFVAATTTLYLTDTASAVDPNGATYDAKEAWTSRGGGVVSKVSDTLNGPVAPRLATVNGDGTNYIEWFTKGLTAFTLSGLISTNIRARESSISANAVMRCEIAVCASDGTSPVVWGASNDGTELPSGGEIEQLFVVAGDDTAITDGQRLRIRVYWDDAPGVAMGTGTATLYYAGTTAAASGDTYITLPQTVTEFVSGGTPVNVSDSATASDTVADRAIPVADSGAGSDVSGLARPVSDTATAADTAVVTVPIPVTDSAVATDTSDKGMTVTEVGSGADTAPTLAKTVTDAAVGADVWSNTAQAAVDSGTGADASAVSVPVAVTDAGAGADASSPLTAAIPVTDIGSGADSVPTLAKAVTDAATAADTSSVTTGNQVNAADSAVGADASALTAALTATDSGTAADTATVSVPATAAVTSVLPSLTQAVAAVTIAAQAPVFDSFNRADGVIGTSDSGHTWIAQSGTWNISTNRVYRATSEMQSTVVIDSGFTTCSLSVDATFPAGLNDAGVVFAGTDDNNYLLLVFEAGGPALHELRLWKRDAGAFTLLSGPHTVPDYSNTTKRARVEWDAATGEIEIWFDYVQITTVTLGSADQVKYATGTRQGLRENAVPAGDKTYFDNYSLTPPAMPALSTLVTARSANTTGWSDPASDTTMEGAGTQVIVVTAGV